MHVHTHKICAGVNKNNPIWGMSHVGPVDGVSKHIWPVQVPTTIWNQSNTIRSIPSGHRQLCILVGTSSAS